MVKSRVESFVQAFTKNRQFVESIRRDDTGIRAAEREILAS
jgi:hypothetical protein